MAFYYPGLDVACGNRSSRRSDLDNFGTRFILLEINFLVFDRSPKTFNEDVVYGTTATIHTDINGGFGKLGREFTACKL